MGFVEYRAEYDSKVEGGEVGFVDFAEAEGVGDEAFSSFYLDVIAYGAWPAKNSSPSRWQ